MKESDSNPLGLEKNNIQLKSLDLYWEINLEEIILFLMLC